MRKIAPVFKPGFTLVEMAIVLVIIGVALVFLMPMGSAMLDAQNRKVVRVKLDTLDAALANFVLVNKRLPCPANGATASGVAGAGAEVLTAGGACNPASQVNGVLPWVTLGLTEADAVDPWGGRFTYRVDPQLAGAAPLPLLMNMSNCDPSATGAAGAGGICQAGTPPCIASAGCTSPANFLANKGLDVWDGQNGAAGFAARQNNRTNGTGAAYVLISHGPTQSGSRNASGNVSPGNGSALHETSNYNNLALAAFPVTQTTVLQDAPLNDNTALQAVPAPPPNILEFFFDDYLSHPTIMTVLNKANLGPRAR